MGSVSDLREELGELCADVGALGGRALGARLQDLERLARSVEHAIVAVVGEADRRAAWAEDGHRGVRGWCVATANWSHGETTARMRSVTLVRDMPTCGRALADGDVGIAQVRELARARANPRCGGELAEAEELLVEQARALPFDDFRRVVQRWEALADADGAHRTHEAAHHNRSADIDASGAEFHLNAHGGAAQGAAFAEIFDRFVDAEFRTDWEQCKARDGDAATADLLARTGRQRRFDALHAMAVAAAGGVGSQPEPIVNIVVDEATYEAALTAMVTDAPIRMPAVSDPTRRRCETLDGTPLDPLDVIAASVVGQVRRVVVGAAGTVIDLGRASRLFTGSARHAAWLQGRRCIWPGCGQHHCQIDHATPWSEHGETNPDNGAPLCGWHNRWKHRGYRVWRDPAGNWHTYRPDGTEIAAA